MRIIDADFTFISFDTFCWKVVPTYAIRLHYSDKQIMLESLTKACGERLLYIGDVFAFPCDNKNVVTINAIRLHHMFEDAQPPYMLLWLPDKYRTLLDISFAEYDNVGFIKYE